MVTILSLEITRLKEDILNEHCRFVGSYTKSSNINELKIFLEIFFKKVKSRGQNLNGHCIWINFKFFDDIINKNCDYVIRFHLKFDDNDCDHFINAMLCYLLQGFNIFFESKHDHKEIVDFQVLYYKIYNEYCNTFDIKYL